MKVAVVTSRYGDLDPVVSPPLQSLDVEWICVTDNPVDIPAPWLAVVEPRPHMTPRMAAKVARCRPDYYTDADVIIWLDASARLRTYMSVEKLLTKLGDSPIAMFRHPARDAIEPEAHISLSMTKYHGQNIREQVAHYRAEGLPESFGLWAAGCIVRRPALVGDFGDRWMMEMARWSWQDQISLPFVLWQTGLRPVDLPGNLWWNPIVRFDYSQRRSNEI